MITKTTNLVATFNNSIGGKHVWTYRNIDTSVSDETIEECCDLLATLGIFEANGVKLFDSSVSAKYVHKTYGSGRQGGFCRCGQSRRHPCKRRDSY